MFFKLTVKGGFTAVSARVFKKLNMVSVYIKDFDAIDKHQAGTVSGQFDPPTFPGATVKVFLWDHYFIPLVASLSK